MALTITIPGAVETTTGSTAPAVLTVGVGAPGQGVPTGGTAGQVLTKIDSTDYNTVFATPSADFITSVTAPLAVGSGVLSVDLSAKANLASPSLTGTPLSTTAAVDTNTTQIATTAYVVGQAGTGTPIVDGSAAVGTSLLYSRQDHVHPTDTTRAALASPTFTGSPSLPTGTIGITQTAADSTTALATTAFVTTADNLKANLASPTFTGTPTLPTGSIGVTQSPGNNTTALATTAFVTAAVPAFASTAQVVAATSTSTSLAPGNQGFLLTNPRLYPLAFINATALSGSGAATSSEPQTFSRQVYLATLAVGRASFRFGAIGTANAGFGTSTAKADQVDFSKKVWISGYAMMGFGGATSYLGDANTMCRISLGGYSTNTTGNMTLKGIGLKKVGGVASTVSLTVHNGTTLTDVASSVTVPDGGGIHWQIYSDGTGNVTLYINGTEAATTTAGPTTATASGSACYREQVEAVATPGVRQAMNANGGWFYTE